MDALLSALTGLATTVAVPFLVQLLKREKWKAGKAKLLAFVVSVVCAVVWVAVTGVAGAPGSGAMAWLGWLAGAITAVFTTATVIYRWFEEKIFKKVPNLAKLLRK
jgi:quinol-cytochrome oxidoreductase complex cytochrome b subunit